MSESSSPTLLPGRTYLSVVAPVPSELCQLINIWNARYGQEPATIGNHITVLISEVRDDFTAARALGAESLGLQPMEVELGPPQTFLPTTPVTYLPLIRGGEGLLEAHEVLQKIVGESASPFVYVPHLTLSHRFEESQLVEAREFYESIPQVLRRFRVEEFRVYSNIGGSWELITAIGLG